jgi:hypothetical protein
MKHPLRELPLPTYICGPCTNQPAFGAAEFLRVEQLIGAPGYLSALLSGNTQYTINPTSHSGIDPAAPWEEHLRWCISRCALVKSFVLLPGWHRSRGATLEVMVADMLKIPVWELLPGDELRAGYLLTLAQLAEVPMPMQLVSQDRAGSAPEQAVAEASDYATWVRATVEADIKRTAPKAMVYGAAGEDMIEIGRQITLMAGTHDCPPDKAAIAGCYFYLVGKLARGNEAIRHGINPSADTVFDISIYLAMTLRIGDTGAWGSSPNNPLDEWWRSLLPNPERPAQGCSWAALQRYMDDFGTSILATEMPHRNTILAAFSVSLWLRHQLAHGVNVSVLSH